MQLTGTLADDGTYLVGNTTSPTPDVVLGTNSLQNAADGVILVACGSCLDADSGFTEFPIGGDVGTALTFLSNPGTTATKVDAIAYDTNDIDAADLIARCYPTTDFPQLQFNEDANAARETDSLSRTSPQEFVAGTPSPGSFAE